MPLTVVNMVLELCKRAITINADLRNVCKARCWVQFHDLTTSQECNMAFLLHHKRICNLFCILQRCSSCPFRFLLHNMHAALA